MFGVLSVYVPVQAHADEAEGPAAALSQAVAAATALGTVGDSEEPDNGPTLSQRKASTPPPCLLLSLRDPCWNHSKSLQASACPGTSYQPGHACLTSRTQELWPDSLLCLV